MAQLIRHWVISCEQRIRKSRIDRSITCRPLRYPNEHITAPGDAMQIDLVPELPPSGGYEDFVTAVDVFSRSLFANPISNQDARTNVKDRINIMTKHSCLPTKLISDKWSAFVSHLIKEVAGVLGITLKHATTKQAQMNWVPECSETSIKQALETETGQRRSLRYNYVIIAVLNYNTFYHASIGCEPSRVFHGRIPYRVLDTKFGIHPQQAPIPSSQIAQDVLDQTEMIYQDARKNAMQAYMKYKTFYDKKASISSQQIMSLSYSWKQIIKEVKFFLWNSGGLGRTSLRKCYQRTVFWYAKLAPTKRKCFFACHCVSSNSNNLYAI